MTILSDQGWEFFSLFHFFTKVWFVWTCDYPLQLLKKEEVLPTKLLQLLQLSEGLDAFSSSAAEFLCDPAHAIFISFIFFPLWKNKISNIPFFFLTFHCLFCWFLPIALLHPYGVHKPSNLNPFLWQWCPPCCPFLCHKGRILHKHWRQDRKAMGWNYSRKINLDIRKQWKVGENGEECSDPWNTPGHCFVRKQKHCPTSSWISGNQGAFPCSSTLFLFSFVFPHGLNLPGHSKTPDFVPSCPVSMKTAPISPRKDRLIHDAFC